MSKVIFGGSSPLTEHTEPSDSESPQAENPTGPQRQPSVQQHLARLYALSPEHNSRNIEHPWYGFWDQALHDTVTADDLVIFPQFVVWASPQGYRDLDAEDEYKPNKREQLELGEQSSKITRNTAKRMKLTELLNPPTTPPRGSVNNHPFVGMEGYGTAAPIFQFDSEFDSPDVRVDSVASTSKFPAAASSSPASAATAPLPRGSTTRIADFAILKLLDKLIKDKRPHRINSVDFTVKFLVEIKRLPSRQLEESVFESEVQRKVNEAKRDAFYQACVLFQSYPDVESLVAIAASGDHWCSSTLRRPNIPQDIREKMGASSSKGKYVSPRWSALMPLEDSLDRLQRLLTVAQ